MPDNWEGLREGGVYTVGGGAYAASLTEPGCSCLYSGGSSFSRKLLFPRLSLYGQPGMEPPLFSLGNGAQCLSSLGVLWDTKKLGWEWGSPDLKPLFPQEELTSTSVEHIIVNPNAAYDKFKDKRVGTKGLGETGLRLGGNHREQT